MVRAGRLCYNKKLTINIIINKNIKAMKKFTLLALAALTMAPASMSAASWEKVVTNASEMKAALQAVGAGAEGDVYTIICDWDASEVVSVGKQKPTQTKGTLIIKSNQTDFDKMPQLQLAFEWQADATNAEIGKRMSLIFENMNLVGTGSYLVDNRRDIFADTIAIRNCDVHGQARSILRFDADKGALKDEKSTLNIDVIDICNSKFHNIDISDGDNWQPFRVFFPVNTFNLHDCMFYDMPYAKTLWEARSPNETPSAINIYNNMVLLAENKVTNKKNGFVVLQLGANVAPGSTLNLNNNIFAGAKVGMLTLHNDSSTYSNTKITDAKGLVIMMNNNVIDTTSYKQLDVLKTEMEANSNVVIETGTIIFPSNDANSWATGGLFQEPENSQYYMLKSNAWYTAGYYDEANMIGATYIGPSIAYVDAYPVKAAVNVAVDGPAFCGYTISPEKAVYYIGDEITITANGHNTYYRTFTKFEGWSDGDPNESRTITLEGDLNLTAKFTETQKVVTAFDFTSVTGKDMEEVKAEIYFGMDPTYQATYTAMNVDTVTIDTIPAVEEGGKDTYVYNMDPEGKVVRGKFPTRAEKFGEEEDLAKRMPVVSRRTVGTIKFVGRNYHVITLNTTGCTGMNFSCFVGTDNHASKKQYAEWSLDGEKWTRFAEVELEAALVWAELAGKLPTDVENKEKVMIRIIADVANSQNIEENYVYNEAGFLNEDTGELDFAAMKTADIHEYIGNVLITAEGIVSGISDVVADKQFDVNAPMYNLMGMKVAKGTKGILIQNGKKVIVK